MIGTSLAHFKITAKLGEGGMGEVYRADDTKLGRPVALKILPAAVANDPERLARFEREARTLAALNDPHIAGIHQVEQDAGKRFLVMELVEGDDLSVRLEKGALPLDQALAAARQIAQALEAAHAQGVIHRDLKPANVKLTPGGQVKVLDFGLAKALDPDLPGANQTSAATASYSPTITAHMTQAGVILGTAAYMSPEQARGESVDRRADIWAFGVLIYEMLTGRRVFSGKTVTDVIAAVVTTDPDWDLLPPETPAQVRRLLQRCTRKDAGQRLHDIADARIALTEAIDSPEVWGQAATAPAVRWSWGALAGGLALGLVLGAGLWHTFAPSQDPAPQAALEPTRLSVEVDESLKVTGLYVSDDGRMVAYMGESRIDDGQENVSRLYLRPLDSNETREVAGTDGVIWADFSPDGRWLAYLTRDRDAGRTTLRKIAVSGGPSVTLLDSLAPSKWFKGTWEEDQRIFIQNGGAIQVLPADGGPPETVIEADAWGEERMAILELHPLPDGERVLLSVGYVFEGSLRARTEVMSLASGERRTLVDGFSQLRYDGSRHDDMMLLWSVDGIAVVPFDVQQAEFTGPMVPVLANVDKLAVSPTGTLFTHGIPMKRLPLIMSRDGALSDLPELESRSADGAWSTFMRWSPDGRKLALVVYEGLRPQLYTYEIESGALSRLGFEGHLPGEMAWSPDGTEIAFTAHSGGPGRVYVRSAAGNDMPRPILEGDLAEDENYEVADWSPDGKTLLVNRHKGGETDIMAVDVASGRIRPVVVNEAYNHSPSFSPNGLWVAYHSDEAGRPEVFVTTAAGGEDEGGQPSMRRFRVSTAGGQHPEWSPDGKAIYFLSPNGRLMEAQVTGSSGGASLSFGRPREIVDLLARGLEPGEAQSYDVHPGGQGFVFRRAADSAGSRNIQVVLNWDVELRARLAGD